MGHTTVRIRDETREVLRELAKAERKPMQAVLEEAVEALRRLRFLEKVNQGYANLRRDKGASQHLDAERSAWDGTLLDGLEVREPRAAKARRSRAQRPRKRR